MLFKIRAKCSTYLMVIEFGTKIMLGIVCDLRNDLIYAT